MPIDDNNGSRKTRRTSTRESHSVAQKKSTRPKKANISESQEEDDGEEDEDILYVMDTESEGVMKTNWSEIEINCLRKTFKIQLYKARATKSTMSQLISTRTRVL